MTGCPLPTPAASDDECGGLPGCWAYEPHLEGSVNGKTTKPAT